MAFLHLPRRVIEETNAELGEIFEIGSHDEDEWVRVLSEILKYYPSTGMLNVNLDQVSPVFAEVTEEIKKTVANLPDSGSSFLPLECLYLNKSALVAMVGSQPPLPKHFTLRRKPKSAALRAELIQKASEAVSSHKKGLGNPAHKLQSSSKKFEAPVRVTQRTSNTTSYRPMPNRGTQSSASSRSIISAATLKHHGRTKLLDITEQPIGGGRELKRRKKLAESEQVEEAKHKKLDNTKAPEPATPDYAAGLTAVTQPAKPPSSPETPSTSIAPPSSTPSYVPQAVSSTSQAPPSDALSESTINLKRELEMHVEHQRQLMMKERQQKQAAAVAMAASSSTSTAPSVADSTRTPPVVPPGAAGNSQQQQGNKRQLTLTRDQMLAAHEMFKNANRVSRAEKALILGFMAGAREKPYAHQGPIITIKLSENTENVTAADGSQQTQLVEMLFEMNYDTGHWRRLKRTRVVSKHGASGTMQKS